MSNIPPPPPPENAPQQPSADQSASGASGYGGMPGAPAGTYASWGSRVASYLIDGLVAIPGIIVMGIGFSMGFSGVQTSTDPTTGLTTTSGHLSGGGAVIAFLGILLIWAIQIWNYCIRQGKTGQSIGKKVMHTKLVSEASGQPIGAGRAFVRMLCHFLDSLLCYLGFLWPLWDAKRQTFADKIMSTVVVPE